VKESFSLNDYKDAFDLWWGWAESRSIARKAEIHEAVMALPPDERRDRDKVNEAVRMIHHEAAHRS
jgi:hypothetical protein